MALLGLYSEVPCTVSEDRTRVWGFAFIELDGGAQSFEGSIIIDEFKALRAEM